MTTQEGIDQLARSIIKNARSQADRSLARQMGPSEIGIVVGVSPLRIKAQSFGAVLTSREVAIAMGAMVTEGMPIELTPSKGGMWIGVPLQEAPGSSNDSLARAGTPNDAAGSGAVQSDARSIDPNSSPAERILGVANLALPSAVASSGKINSKGYFDPMGGANASWGATHARDPAGNPENPWASINASDIFAASGTMTYALARCHVYSIGSGSLSQDPATAGQGAYLREANGRRWWYRHIQLSCRVGQYLEQGAPVGRLVGWTRGGAHLHLGTDRGGYQGVFDAKPDGSGATGRPTYTKITGSSAEVSSWWTAAGYSGTPSRWAGAFVHHVYKTAQVSHGGILDPPRAGQPAEAFARALAGGYLSDNPQPGCIVVQGEVKAIGGQQVMQRPENIFIFVSGSRSSAVLIGGNLGASPGEVKKVTRALPATNYFCIIPPGLVSE